MTDNEEPTSSYDVKLSAPADGIPAFPPVATKIQLLPFGGLTWENFERLCYRLAGRSERVEYVARYGRMGQAQQGIDLFVRLSTGKYEIWQAKRYESIAASDIRAAVAAFRGGTWKDKSEQFILAIQASIADTKVQDEIETQASILKAEGITFVARGGEQLSDILRGLPELVDDFFGRQWVHAFLGEETSRVLGARLDGSEFARVQLQLGKFYDAHFRLLDVGVAMPLGADEGIQATTPSLLRRYAAPDVLVRDIIDDEKRVQKSGEAPVQSDPSAGVAGARKDAPPSTTRRRDYVRRTPLANWLGDGLDLAIVGEAGSGKSTLLRCIALDLLTMHGVFPQLARRWSELVPIHVSFSRWSKLSAKLGRAAGLKEVVADALQPALTADLVSLLDRAIDERRVCLLLDGLDEWSDEQAARTTLQHILAFVATHNLPTIATARPRGLDKIGTIPPGWRIAELAPLSVDQQRTLAGVWFSRGLGSAHDPDIRGPIVARLDRFFAELQRDRRLSSLASNPLLLVGLVALSIRQIALPRNRTQAIQSLVAIMVETHPEHRATAAGDTKARFAHMPEAEDRRAALGRLAFVARTASGGGTYDIKDAKRTIRDYLADSATFAYSTDRAQSAASEILAVNAETVGLLVERAPGEIGFAHAVFEEYLAADYMQRWSLADIIAFVSEHSGNPLWRNVISNLVSLQARPTEVESVVTAIENARIDETTRDGAINREVLLADIAFNSSRKLPITAQRLTDRAFAIIECGDWIPARREVLKITLANTGEKSTPTPVDNKLESWAPCRSKYLSDLFETFGGWKSAPDLLEVLLRGLHGEERMNQRSAARSLGRVFGGDEGVQRGLVDELRHTMELSVAAASLEALTVGWRQTPNLSDFHDAAAISRDPTLRLVGIAGRLATGREDQRDLDGLVELLSEFPEIDLWDRPGARLLLSQHWPDDARLIDIALNAVRRHGAPRDAFERESAMHYLVRCSPTNLAVTNWVRQELMQKYPFSLTHGDLWDCVAAFAIEHTDIRATVTACIQSEDGWHRLHEYQGLLVKLGSTELRDALIAIARARGNMTAYWAVRPLIESYGRLDSVVGSFLDEIALWDDEKLNELAAILPHILIDFTVCRARLLSLARNLERPRYDLIARGFATLGCTAADSEVIDTLLDAVGRGAPAFDPGETLLTHFFLNPRVREYAGRVLCDRSPPLGTLARVYESDALIRQNVLAYANSLPVTLRGEIVEIAAVEAHDRPGFERVLHDYDIESDGELKIAASIYYHRSVARRTGGVSTDHLRKLVDDLQAVGPDLHERRAAAFAGMILLGRISDLGPMIDYGDKPMRISSGTGYGNESESLMALMCEHWEDLRRTFGVNLAGRFGDYGDNEGHLWDCLAPHINASPAARRDFLAFCNQTHATLGLRSFITLAREIPSSGLLLEHCWRLFGREVTGRSEPHSPWALKRLRLEIAYTFRDQYRDRADVRDRLREAFKGGSSAEVVALVLIDPTDPLLNGIQYTPMELAMQFSEWAAAMHLASARLGAEDFVNLVTAMINRDAHGIWDFQEITNRTIVERIRRDEDVGRQLQTKLASDPTEAEIASIPHFLTAAGALDNDDRQRCRSLLKAEARYPVPRAGYDAIADSTRSVSQSLLDVVAPSFLL